VQWQTWLWNLGANAAAAAAGYLAFGGWRLFRARYEEGPAQAGGPLERRHWATLAVIAAFALAVVAGGVNTGFAAFAAALALGLLDGASHAEALKRTPWGVIVMVCGMTVLVSLLERTQGIDLFAGLLARVATPDTLPGVVAGATGLVSVYSSTSGVVLPAFLPMAPALAARMPADPLELAWAMMIGSHLVDISPVSTVGALCLAAAPAGADTRALFNRLLALGLRDGRGSGRGLLAVVGRPRLMCDA
jgi:di/tricarboxylate transporter